MKIHRYSEWDGCQDIFELEADELMDKLGRELMSQSDLSEALRMMQRNGIKDNQGKQLPGIEELLQRLRQMKQSQLDKSKLSLIMEEIRQQMEKIVAAEQEGIQRRSEEARQKAKEGNSELSTEAQQRLLQTIEDMVAQDLKNLDELAERLQDRIAQAQSLLDSMSLENRESLENLLRSVLGDGTQYELAKLAAQYSNDDLGKQYPFSGEESISYTEALELMETLQKMDELEVQLEDALHNRSLDVIDDELLKELMGDEAAEELEKLCSIAPILEEAGYIRGKGSKYELTPRGMRKIGQKALEDIFTQFRKDRVGGHNINLRGRGGERIDETKQYEFGDEFQLHLQKTIMNSLYRETGTQIVPSTSSTVA